MTSDDDGLPFFHPERKPPVRRPEPTPTEPLWELRQQHVTWSAELLFRGESYGWECRVLRDGELIISRRFVVREAAESWALERRTDIENGWIDA